MDSEKAHHNFHIFLYRYLIVILNRITFYCMLVRLNCLFLDLKVDIRMLHANLRKEILSVLLELVRIYV